MEGGKDSREEGRENEWGEDTNGSLGKGSGARGASTSRDDDYLRGRADRTTEVAEDVRGWKEATQRQGRSGGLKVSVMRKGGRKRQAGDGDGAVNFTEQIRGDDDGSDKARRQCARGNDGDNGVMSPPQSAAGAAHGGGGDAVRFWCRGDAASMHGTIALATMVLEAALPGGGLVQGTFWS